MYWSKCRYVLLGCFLTVVHLLLPTPAMSYEAELQAVAGKLIAQLEAAGQKSGTVLDFTDLQGQGTELGRFLAQELSDQLVRAAKTLSFVDRANLQHLLRENKLSMEGLVNPESSRKLGNMIGLDTVIYGTVTPLGDKIRLSVRAIAVETGRIVASQSESLPDAAELQQLYNRGVAGAPTGATTPDAATASGSSDPRSRFRPDSIKLTGSEIVVDASSSNGTIVNVTVENLAGTGLSVGLLNESVTARSCVGPAGNDATGLPVVSRGGEHKGAKLTWMPAGAKVSLRIRLSHCQDLVEAKQADVSMMLLVVFGDESVQLSVTATKVPVRQLKYK